MTNKIRDEKAYEHARDIVDTVRDLALDTCEVEARQLDKRLARDPNVSNEARALIVFDCFADAACGYDIPEAVDAFCERFPEHEGAL